MKKVLFPSFILALIYIWGEGFAYPFKAQWQAGIDDSWSMVWPGTKVHALARHQEDAVSIARLHTYPFKRQRSESIEGCASRIACVILQFVFGYVWVAVTGVIVQLRKISYICSDLLWLV